MSGSSSRPFKDLWHPWPLYTCTDLYCVCLALLGALCLTELFYLHSSSCYKPNEVDFLADLWGKLPFNHSFQSPSADLHGYRRRFSAHTVHHMTNHLQSAEIVPLQAVFSQYWISKRGIKITFRHQSVLQCPPAYLHLNCGHSESTRCFDKDGATPRGFPWDDRRQQPNKDRSGKLHGRWMSCVA